MSQQGLWELQLEERTAVSERFDVVVVALPKVTFTDPEIGACGLTERHAAGERARGETGARLTA